MKQSISDHLTSMREMFNHVPKIGVTLREGFRSSSLSLSEQFDFDCKCNALGFCTWIYVFGPFLLN